VICILINANDPAAYDTADILPGRANWGSTSPPALPDNARNLALASHVLGHVDDGRAPGELYRILIPSDSRDSAQVIRGLLHRIILGQFQPRISGWPRQLST